MTRGTQRAFPRPGSRHRSPVGAVLALALLTGCSGGGAGAPATTASTAAVPPATASTGAVPPPAAPSTPSLKDKIASFFSGATQKNPQSVANANPDVECPFLD